jgi:rhodanese-related sulfurtransferase
MTRTFARILIIGLSSSLLCISAQAATAQEGPKITMEEVKAMLESPDVIILDVRPDEQWKQSSRKLPGAVHEDPEDVESWADKYPKEKTLILY